MRLLKINDTIVDIDAQTAIGITYQGIDLKDPSVRKIATSNSFSIPTTLNNLMIFGLAGSVHAIGAQLYDSLIVNYWINNDKIISLGKVNVDSISDRIYLTIISATDVFDKMKLLKGYELWTLLFYWLRDGSGEQFPTVTDQMSGTIGDFMSVFGTNTHGIVIPAYFGNLYNQLSPDGSYYLEDKTNIFLNYPQYTDDTTLPRSFDLLKTFYEGGHVCIYFKTFARFIESHFGVNIGASEEFDGNMFDYDIIQKLLFPVRNFNVERGSGIFFNLITTDYQTNSSAIFAPLNKASIMTDISAYDILMSAIKLVGGTIDNKNGRYKIRRIDQMEDVGNAVNWSGKVDSSVTPSMKPYIDGYGQSSIIKYDKVADGIGETVGAKTVQCNNKNIAATVDLFTIKSYVPPFAEITGGVIPDISSDKTFTEIVFFITDGLTTDDIYVHHYSHAGTEYTALLPLFKAAIYDMSQEYVFFDKLNSNPKVYTVGMWITNNDMRLIDNFTLIYIRELNGLFYPNKITGFNPDKSTTSTSIELMKIGEKVIVESDLLVYFSDSNDEIFTDSEGNYFY